MILKFILFITIKLQIKEYFEKVEIHDKNIFEKVEIQNKIVKY